MPRFNGGVMVFTLLVLTAAIWTTRTTTARQISEEARLVLTAGGRTFAGPGIWLGDTGRFSVFISPARPICLTAHNLGDINATMTAGNSSTDLLPGETRTVCNQMNQEGVLFGCDIPNACKVLWRVDSNQ